MEPKVTICDWCGQPVTRGQEFAELQITHEEGITLTLIHKHCFNEFCDTAIKSGEQDNITFKVEESN